jgi:hypothetical protein
MGKIFTFFIEIDHNKVGQKTSEEEQEDPSSTTATCVQFPLLISAAKIA